MMKFIYVTDVHGMVDVYEKAFELGEAKDVDFLVFGGDITSGANPNGQKFFLEFYLARRLKEFRKKVKKPVFIMMGNDDFSSNFCILRKAGRQKIAMVLHNRFFRMDGFYVAGYPYVNPTPFLLKDWEKSEKEIEEDLGKLFRKIDHERTVYVFHAPPHGTKLDVLHNGEHEGSTAIRGFIEKFQPLLTLHGHIHESSDMTGAISERLGKTLCVNPGNARIISVELETLKMKEM